MRRRVLTIVLVVLAVGRLAAAMSLLPRYQITAFGWREGGGVLDAWRLASAHFVHVDAHLAINLAAASLLLAAGIWQQGLGATLAAAAAAMLAVDVGLLAGPWPIEWYVGMSGLLHGLFVAGAFTRAAGRRPCRATDRRVAGRRRYGEGMARSRPPAGEAGWLGAAGDPDASLRLAGRPRLCARRLVAATPVGQRPEQGRSQTALASPGFLRHRRRRTCSPTG